MESAGLAIMKLLGAEGEIDLRVAAEVLPKRTNDHRDFYVLASLIKNQYADLYVTTDGQPFREGPERMIAINLYMWVTGGAKEFEYMGMKSSGADFGKEKLFATAKGYLLLDELQAKRAERAWALGTAIFAAILAAGLTGVLGG